MDIEHFDYYLPDDLIAKKPLKNRGNSKLLILDRISGKLIDTYFYELTNLLDSSHFLVLNNTKVNKARLFCTKETGGSIEVLLLEKINDFEYSGLVKGKINKSIKVKTGDYILTIDKTAHSEIKHIYFNNEKASVVMEKQGSIPIPPYFKRKTNIEDEEYYQTVFAKVPGSAAAATAGLHFDNILLESLGKKGIRIIELTLNISYSTFKPIKSKILEEHQMHMEDYYIPPEAATSINEEKKKGKKLVAIGTTVVRALESAANKSGFIEKTEHQKTDLFIKPDYTFKIVDQIITNFHLPRSSLLVLVAAFAGLNNIMKSYAYAVEKGYRFYSYGDAMFLI